MQSKETKIKVMVDLINNHDLYVEAAAKVVGISETTAYRYLKSHYPKKKEMHKALLAKSRANKRKHDEAEKVLSEKAAPENQTEVILIETGYLMKVGVAGVAAETLDMFVPQFCINSLEKLSLDKRPKVAKVSDELLTAYYAEWMEKKIVPINIPRSKETLFVEPESEIRPHTKGVVATGCDLVSRGFKVRIYTTSKEIERVANMQECGFIVTRLEPTGY